MDKKAIVKKIYDTRANIINQYPFFGRLLFKLKLEYGECGTAYTDMRRIVFDPRFAARISIEELGYVMIHEVLHCALKHCIRGFGKQHDIYNIACDIVVNSTMLEMYDTNEIVIDNIPLMHLAPNGKEGRLYSVEEVYSMLMRLTPKELASLYGRGGLDIHDMWTEIDGETLGDLWQHYMREVVASCGVGSGIPRFMQRHLKEIGHNPRTNWRQVLHDFIQFDRSDYSFLQPDRRYQSDIIMPSFCENMDGSKVDKLWFLVDTSGSISDETLSVAYNEIKLATEQIENLSGMLSFFDFTVSTPQTFESIEDILAMKPIGGGGTNFKAIFEKLLEYAEIGDLPNVVVIITDGYASFPKEEAALGVPVIWMIVDSDVVPPWGSYVFISTE